MAAAQFENKPIVLAAFSVVVEISKEVDSNGRVPLRNHPDQGIYLSLNA